MTSLPVVVNLYAENYCGAHRGDYVGDNKRPVAQHEALHDEEHRAKTQHYEGGQGNARGVAGAYGGDGLGQVAQHHADACQPTYNFYHSGFVLRT